MKVWLFSLPPASCFIFSPLLAAFLSGCVSHTPAIPACSVTVTDKNDILKNEEHNILCNCNCPPAKTNMFEFGGMMGGLSDLWSSAKN